jgi:hypothetical protein
LQVTVVGNILAVENSATHTTYILDDRMGTPVRVCVWKKADDVWPEQYQLRFVVYSLTEHSWC